MVLALNREVATITQSAVHQKAISRKIAQMERVYLEIFYLNLRNIHPSYTEPVFFHHLTEFQ